MSRVIDERDALIDLLESTLGDLVQIVTTDEAEARPAPGKVAVFIEPPELAYPDWTGEPTITWRLDVIAGTTATQPAAMPLIIDAIDLLARTPASRRPHRAASDRRQRRSASSCTAWCAASGRCIRPP